MGSTRDPTFGNIKNAGGRRAQRGVHAPGSSFTFDTTDRPSMGDPQFVDGLIREMLDETRRALVEAPSEETNPQVEIKKIAEKWRDRLWAGNAQFTQTMSVEAQNAWLAVHNLGVDDPGPRAGVGGLVVATLKRFVEAVVPFAEGRIHSDQLEFWLEAAIEDCVCMLLGIENPAD